MKFLALKVRKILRPSEVRCHEGQRSAMCCATSSSFIATGSPPRPLQASHLR
eukprot:CAMPEP_0173407882 /NCGR_PEP_ID=MMETSP1356-20130122/68303_1 /TAXON_ID=77927 ORGANISM="Hemiselmis virescens, Strain PCC157" /NCGR_SAMPLE_ID=MMETSP1356 /ASSEMBLY_ACC=CAM_ASM_000847 /LENGTH=51 /DNA_ID=CAMNT_0014369111 /DNA_START=175 /DNA_END=326 /DNA_ORIENTATION=-